VKRGDIYLVQKGLKKDPKSIRPFVIVSRQALIDSKFSTIICAPVYSSYEELSTQVSIGTREGLKKKSAIFCDNLMSIEKKRLTYYIGMLSQSKIKELDKALANALDLIV